jgi:hypothetical protein
MCTWVGEERDGSGDRGEEEEEEEDGEKEDDENQSREMRDA